MFLESMKASEGSPCYNSCYGASLPRNIGGLKSGIPRLARIQGFTGIPGVSIEGVGLQSRSQGASRIEAVGFCRNLCQHGCAGGGGLRLLRSSVVEIIRAFSST